MQAPPADDGAMAVDTDADEAVESKDKDPAPAPAPAATPARPTLRAAAILEQARATPRHVP